LFALRNERIYTLVFRRVLFKALNTAVNETHSVLQKALDDVIKDGISKNPGNERD
jgi:hypothetical protein